MQIIPHSDACSVDYGYCEIVDTALDKTVNRPYFPHSSGLHVVKCKHEPVSDVDYRTYLWYNDGIGMVQSAQTSTVLVNQPPTIHSTI